MNWNAIIGVAATLSLFLPAVAIVYYKLYKDRSLAALLVSYLITALYNLMAEGHHFSSGSFRKRVWSDQQLPRCSVDVNGTFILLSHKTKATPHLYYPGCFYRL